MADDPRAYKSPEELEELLRVLSARMHHINRVALGESKYAWWYAELLKAVAGLAPLLRDDTLRKEFGDGWSAGTDPDPRARILSLLSERLPEK